VPSGKTAEGATHYRDNEDLCRISGGYPSEASGLSPLAFRADSRRREPASVLPEIPARTLGILHLTIAKEISADILATADRTMAAGARALGLSVKQF